MFICPACDESVDQIDIENGVCPHCGASFDADEPEDENEEELKQ